MKKSIVIPTLCLAVLSTPAFEKAVHAASPTGTKISSSDSTTKSVTKYVNVDANSSLLLRSKPSTSASTLDRLKRGTAVTVYSISGNWAKVKVDGKTGYVSAEYLVTTKPSSSTGSSSSTTTKYVNVDKGSHLILRSTASTSGSVLASLNPGTSVTVISTSGAWSKVKAGSQTGYVHSEYLTTTKPSSTSSSSSTTKTTTKYVNVDKGSHLILRSTASTSGSVLASLDPGTSVTVLSTSGEWSKVQVGSKTGYVHTEYLTTTKPSSTSSSSSTTKTTTKYVNVDKGSHLILRSTASTSGSVLASLNPGTSVTVISTSGAWSKVKAGSKTGYVHTEFLTSTKPSTSGTVSASSSSEATVKTTTKYVNVDKGSHLILRSTASTSGSVLASLDPGTSVTVLSTSGEWSKVQVGSKTGYVHTEYLTTTKPSSTSSSSSTTKTTTKYVNVDKGSHLILRSTASTSGSVLASLDPGTSVTVLSTSGEWSKIQVGSKTGYVHTEYLTSTKPSSTSNSSSSTTKTTTKYVNVDKGSHLILRSTASTSGSVLASLDPGTSVTVLSTSGEWSKVQVGSKTGYVHTEYLTSTKPSSTSNSSSSTTKTTTKYVNVDKGSHLILRSTASTSGSVLASLDPGTSVTVLSTSGEWSKVQVGNKTGYVHTEYLTSTKPSTSDDQSGNSDSEQTVTKYTTADLNLRKSNSTSSSVITVIPKGTAVTVYSETNGWARVTVNGNTGYVSTKYLTGGATLNGKVTTVEQDYDISLSQLTNIEMKASPQTDTNNRYVRSDAVKKTSSTTGTLDGSWNVRDGAGTNYDVAETLPSGTSVTILDTVAGTDGHTWYKISYNKTWKNATANEVEYYLNPKNFINDPVSSLQFLKLSTTANIDVNEVNQKILAGKGTLAGKAQSFITAAKTYGVNELYLISHALLETGNGTSQLAKGYPYTYKGKTYTVYNMYGIGAYDGNAVEDGAAYAYSQGWFSPEAAIIGGARFIANGYISAGQDTLYAMRWNPSGAATYGYATHQYATDIGWAYKQVNEIYNLYNLLDSYSITLEVPNYK